MVDWFSGHPEAAQQAGATLAQLAAVEDVIASPLPTDLRLLLSRHNGAALPSGQLLRAGALDGSDGSAEPIVPELSVLGALSQLAQQLGSRPDDPELLLPYFRTDEGSLLAFDRSAGPVADTWPVVDYQLEGGQARLVHRTLSGWCRMSVAQWSDQSGAEVFDLDSYLASGRRHVAVEPDVSVAHATVAHALRRAGQPEEALAAYLKAARCVPSQPWCDWEALKLAALLRLPDEGLEAARRLCAHAPASRWRERETSPERVADMLGKVGAVSNPRDPILRLLDQLSEQSDDGAEIDHIASVRRYLMGNGAAPATVPPRPTAIETDDEADIEERWQQAEQAYREGRIREEDLLLDPAYQVLRAHRPLSDLLRIRREF